MTDPFTILTDAELSDMQVRAYHEAVRAYREALKAPKELRSILMNSADSANAYWLRLRAEQSRRRAAHA